MKKSIFVALVIAAGLQISPAYASAPPKVAVSIKPLHSIAAAIMKGVAEPELIVKGASSPHTYSMRPSDAELLQHADIVFWTGPELEAFLEKPIEALSGNTLNIPLIDDSDVIRLPPRESGTFEPHQDGDEHAGAGDHGEEVDPHFWLDPENARAIARVMTRTLGNIDPNHQAAYEANRKAFDAQMVSLEDEVSKEVAPIEGRPYIVFHDAYQYFERRFGLSAAGSITIKPEVQPGAARISEIETKLRSLGAICIFSEPQFEPRLIQTMAEESGAHRGVLDPLGADIPEGPDMYETLIKGLATGLNSCLSSS